MIGTGRVNAKSGLHLREKAEVTSHILATVPYESVVSVWSREGNWLKVTYNLKQGFLYKDYVDVITLPDVDHPYDPPALQSYSKTIFALVVAIVAAIIAFSWGSLGWKP